MGYLFNLQVLTGMKASLYKRFMLWFKNSLLKNLGTEIPVRLWNKGPL